MIVIPMAGLSSRFFNAGFNKPKYMLEAHGKTLFEYSVESFKAYFDTDTFLFIVRSAYGTPEFVKQKSIELGIKTFSIVTLDHDTRGQAETVYLGLHDVIENEQVDKEQEVTIFNIDTFRPNFIKPNIPSTSDGYLEVFKGSGDNWSFALPENESSTKVIKTAEKKQISDLCSTGLYQFKNCSIYFKAFEEYLSLPIKDWEKGELYIAPIYNILINNGHDIHYHLINESDVIFCGTPDEYNDLINKQS